MNETTFEAQITVEDDLGRQLGVLTPGGILFLLPLWAKR